MRNLSLVLLFLGAMALDCGVRAAAGADANEDPTLVSPNDPGDAADANMADRIAAQHEDIRGRNRRITVLTGAMLLLVLLVVFFALAIVLRSGSRWK